MQIQFVLPNGETIVQTRQSGGGSRSSMYQGFYDLLSGLKAGSAAKLTAEHAVATEKPLSNGQAMNAEQLLAFNQKNLQGYARHWAKKEAQENGMPQAQYHVFINEGQLYAGCSKRPAPEAKVEAIIEPAEA